MYPLFPSYFLTPLYVYRSGLCVSTTLRSHSFCQWARQTRCPSLTWPDTWRVSKLGCNMWVVTYICICDMLLYMCIVPTMYIYYTYYTLTFSLYTVIILTPLPLPLQRLWISRVTSYSTLLRVMANIRRLPVMISLWVCCLTSTLQRFKRWV